MENAHHIMQFFFELKMKHIDEVIIMDVLQGMNFHQLGLTSNSDEQSTRLDCIVVPVMCNE